MKSKSCKQSKRQTLLRKAVIHCQIGRDVLDDKELPKGNYSRSECALFNLLYAVEHIAEGLGEE